MVTKWVLTWPGPGPTFGCWGAIPSNQRLPPSGDALDRYLPTSGELGERVIPGSGPVLAGYPPYTPEGPVSPLPGPSPPTHPPTGEGRPAAAARGPGLPPPRARLAGALLAGAPRPPSSLAGWYGLQRDGARWLGLPACRTALDSHPGAVSLEARLEHQW